MDHCFFRSIILEIQYRLSDDHRTRLHFFLANHVPRSIRDNLTLKGTLDLMDSLFDQNKINEQDFTLLIEAFKKSRCAEAVKLLEEHGKRSQSNGSNELTSPLTKSLNEEVTDDQDQEDRSAAEELINSITNRNSYPKISTNSDRNSSSVAITIEDESIVSKQVKQYSQSFGIPIKMSKCLFVIILCIIILIGIVIFLSIIWRDKQIEQLNNQINHQEKDKTKPLIKAGRQFGGTGGNYFDDSLLPNFTYSHYLHGLLAHDNNEGLESYQFFYLSCDGKQHPIPPYTYGNQKSSSKKEFLFEKDDKINEVKGQIINKTIVTPNGTSITMEIITGLQFFSKGGHASLSYHYSLGKPFTERFDGYTLGYVTGRSDQYIHQLQFFWYRTEIDY